jgi:hypothetical protein
MTNITGDPFEGKYESVCEYCGKLFNAETYKEAANLLWEHLDKQHPQNPSVQ